MDCASWGKCADCMTKWCPSLEGLQVSTGFVIPISRYWFFINCRLNRNRAQQLFFAVLHQRCIKAVYRPYGFVWLFFGIFTAALLQLSVSLPQHQRSHKNALLQWTENSVRETFLHRSLSANTSLKQRCFNVFCIIRVHIQGNFSAFHSTYHSAYRYTVKENNEALSSQNHLSLELKRL